MYLVFGWNLENVLDNSLLETLHQFWFRVTHFALHSVSSFSNRPRIFSSVVLLWRLSHYIFASFEIFIYTLTQKLLFCPKWKCISSLLIVEDQLAKCNSTLRLLVHAFIIVYCATERMELCLGCFQFHFIWRLHQWCLVLFMVRFVVYIHSSWGFLCK
jgi:hypothetical protein